jgi:hypothetical protein
MRSAMNRSRSGLIIRPSVETRNHDGSVLHAGGPARSVKLPPAMGFCRRSASTCRVQAISSASEVSGSCTATTWWPRRCRMAITRLQLDPSTHAPCTSSTLAFGRPLPVPAGVASAAGARPEVCTAAKPANAAVPFNTARRVGVPVGSLLEALGSQAAESTHATLNRPKQAVNQALHKRVDWTMPSASLAMAIPDVGVGPRPKRCRDELVHRCHWPSDRRPGTLALLLPGVSEIRLTTSVWRNHWWNAPFHFTAGQAPRLLPDLLPQSVPTPESLHRAASTLAPLPPQRISP